MEWVKSGEINDKVDVIEKIGPDGKIHRNFITRNPSVSQTKSSNFISIGNSTKIEKRAKSSKGI